MQQGKANQANSSHSGQWVSPMKSEQEERVRIYRLKIRELMLALQSSDLVWAIGAYQSLFHEKLLEGPRELFEELGTKLSRGQVSAAQELAKKLFAIQYAVEALERKNT
jgi:hypothetical protein